VEDCPGGPGGPGGAAGGGDGSEHAFKRADARRNRAQILLAAEICFAEQGVGVPIDDIARRAGVGVGTVYRHFPTKEALAEAVVVTRMQKLVDEAKELAESDDPGGAFFDFLALLSKSGSEKRDLMDALSGAGIEVKERLSPEKDRLTAAMGTLLERAQQAGAVRADVGLADLFGLVMGTCASATHTETGCSQARMFSIVCDGLRVPSAQSALYREGHLAPTRIG
jgi:AcrR family transcriptional regulator